MRDTLVETVEYRGYKIEIHQDTDPQPPYDVEDENVVLVTFHRDLWLEHEGFDKETCRDMYNDRKHPLRKQYHVFPVEAYIHGGAALALSGEGNFPDRQWDVSNPVGFLFLAKSEWKRKDKAEKFARATIEEWNQYLSGEVYGYVVIDPEGEDGDSVWGYYGDWEKYCLQEAKSAVDYAVEQKRKERQEQLKAYIRAHVPIEYRFAGH